MPKPNLKALSKKLELTLRRHSPEILQGIGIAGMITTTVLAVRATPKALVLLGEVETDKGEELTKKETVQTVYKCYIPATVTGALSVTCLVCASSAGARQRAALAAAYSLSETALNEYRQKVIETIGKNKEQAVCDEIDKEHIKEKPVSNNEVIITEKGDMLCFEPISGRYFRSDIDKLRKVENDLNRRMRDENYITLSEFYYEIGLRDTDISGNMGWDVSKGYIDLRFSSQLAEDDTPCLVVGHNKPPAWFV